MRGDRPRGRDTIRQRMLFTPHARGSTWYMFPSCLNFAVYPACAGIDPVLVACEFIIQRLPRMRGDRPYMYPVEYFKMKFTPHARGSTPIVYIMIEEIGVYPACAGIDRRYIIRRRMPWRLPRMRGDRPKDYAGTNRLYQFTPHARGSTATPIGKT